MNISNIYNNIGGNPTNMIIIANNPWNYNIYMNNMNGTNGTNGTNGNRNSRRSTTVTPITDPQNTPQQPQNMNNVNNMNNINNMNGVNNSNMNSFSTTNDYKQQQQQKSATKTRPVLKLFNEIIAQSNGINQKQIISTLTAFKMLFEKLALKVTLKIFGIGCNEQIVDEGINIISNKWMKELTNFVGFVRGVNGYVSAAESIDIYRRIESVTKEMNGYLLGYHRKYNISVLDAMNDNDICDENKCKINGTVYVVHHLQEITKRLYNNYAIGPINRKQLLLFINYAQKNGKINDVTEILRQIYFNGFTILSNAKFNEPMDVVHSSFGRPQITISPYIGQFKLPHSFNYEIVQNLARIAKQTKEPEIGGNFKYARFVYKCENNVTIEFAKNNLTVLNVKYSPQRNAYGNNGNNGKFKMNPNAAAYQPNQHLATNHIEK